MAGPHRRDVQSTIATLETEVRALEHGGRQRTAWLAEHPDTVRHLAHLDTQLEVAASALQVQRDLRDGIERAPQQNPGTQMQVHQGIHTAHITTPPLPRPASPGPDLGL